MHADASGDESRDGGERGVSPLAAFAKAELATRPVRPQLEQLEAIDPRPLVLDVHHKLVQRFGLRVGDWYVLEVPRGRCLLPFLRHAQGFRFLLDLQSGSGRYESAGAMRFHGPGLNPIPNVGGSGALSIDLVGNAEALQIIFPAQSWARGGSGILQEGHPDRER